MGICVYFKQYIMTHRLPDIRLIDNLQVQEFVGKLEEWNKEEGSTTNPLVKNSDQLEKLHHISQQADDPFGVNIWMP